MIFVSNGHFRGALNINFSIASMKFSYGDRFSFPNKLTCDNNNICTKLLIMKLKIINNCPSNTLICLKPLFSHSFKIFFEFEVRPEVTNIFITRDNVLHRKRIYLQINESYISSTMSCYSKLSDFDFKIVKLYFNFPYKNKKL